jgi:hypothetical protein
MDRMVQGCSAFVILGIDVRSRFEQSQQDRHVTSNSSEVHRLKTNPGLALEVCPVPLQNQVDDADAVAQSCLV